MYMLCMSCASGVCIIYSMCDQSRWASCDSGINGALTYMECAWNVPTIGVWRWDNHWIIRG